MESTLAAAFKDLTGDVGHYLGYGRGQENGDLEWTDQQARDVERCVKGGLRNVYHCGNDWSFLKPIHTTVLPEGKSEVALPDDCGGIEGRVSISTTGSADWCPLDVVGVGTVHQYRLERSESTGQPNMVAIEWEKHPSARGGQRCKLSFWPEADKAYTVTLRYYLLPGYLDGTKPYVYGGAAHAELFLASCKAVAERDLDDIDQGPQFMEFQRRLGVSMQLDRRHKEQLIGYNGDRSDGREWGWRGGRSDYIVTFNGVEYE